jgi:cephalosporin-C deacetylase
LTHNLTDRNTYSYRGFYVDALRAVDFLLSRSEVDGRRIGITGGSQGGALTIVTAALRHEITCAAAGAPYLCGFMDAARLTHSYPYEEINDYLRMHPEREDLVRETLNYFDGINFAPAIQCPIIVSLGLQDDVCPPETGFALFREIGSVEKKLYTYDNCMHDAGSAWHAAIVDACVSGSITAASTQLARHLARTALTLIALFDPEHEPTPVREALRLVTGTAPSP